MGAAAISFEQGEKHNVLITIPDTVLLSEYYARIEVRVAFNAKIELAFQEELDLNGQQILLTIPASATENINGKYMWQLMLVKLNDPEDVIKFAADSFIINSSIVKKVV